MMDRFAPNTLNAVRIAEQRKGRNNTPALRGWDVGTLRSADIGSNRETTFSYRISVLRQRVGHIIRTSTSFVRQSRALRPLNDASRGTCSMSFTRTGRSR